MNTANKLEPFEKPNRSQVIWKILEEATEPLTCREIAARADMEKDISNIAATLAVFLKYERAETGDYRECRVSGKRAKTYSKKKIETQVVAESVVVEGEERVLELSGRKIVTIIIGDKFLKIRIRSEK